MEIKIVSIAKSLNNILFLPDFVVNLFALFVALLVNRRYTVHIPVNNYKF